MPLAPVRPIALGFFVVGSVDWLVEVALTTAVYEQTQSTSWVAACVAMRFVPNVAVGPLAGVLADRVDRRTVVVGSCVSRVLVLAVLAGVAFAGGEPAALLVLAVVDSALATPYRPAALAMLPRAVGPTGLAAANATVGRALQGTWIAGPAAGAVAAGLLDPAFAFGVAALALGGAATIARTVAACPPVRSSDVVCSPVEMLRDGVMALRLADGGPALAALAVVVELVFGFELVAHVEVAAQRLGIGPAGAGWLTAFVGVGGVLGGALAASAARGARAGGFAALAGAAFGLCLATLAFLTTPALAFGLMLVEGVANVVYDVLTLTMLHRLLAGGLLARAQSLIDASGALALTVGSLGAPWVIGRLGLPGALILVGVVTVVAVGAVTPRLMAADRATATRVTGLAPVVDCFRATALFEMARYPVVERVAATSRLIDADPGAVVVAQGDPAATVHVVEAGRLRVVVESAGGTRAVNELGPGDWFGEIGVVGQQPRTATVVAATRARVWSIPGPAFLDAVASSAVVADRLGRGMQVRLDRTNPEPAVP
jgi:Cyclic nucleotide-binding domain